MNNSFAWLLELLKKQGLSFVLLAFAIWYFYGEVQRLEQKSDQCHGRIIEVYQGVLLENVDLMKQVNRELQEINMARTIKAQTERKR
jgi:hypothetical protein